MAHMGFRNFGRWVAGALCAAVLSFAHAQPPRAAYGGGHEGGGFRAFAAQPRGAPRAYAAQHRGAGPGRGPRVAAGAGWMQAPGGGRTGAVPFGGQIRTVSEETRPFQQQDSSPPYVRAGSIRADVTRYNEERDSSRIVPRPPGDVPRPPPPSPYRN